MLRLLIVNILDREEKIMDEQITTLASLTIDGKGSYGIGASAVPFSKDLYTYLRITDIKDDGTLNLQDLKSVDNEKASEYLLKPNDIVFARTGASTGRNYFYDGTDGEFVYAGFLIKFSIDEKKVNPKYIKYFCQSKQYKDWINSFNTGSTRGNINAQTLGKMPIPLIERKTQDALVCILSSIDEKIRKDNEINNNLEQQAQAIFKSWFVDFEPFNGEMPHNWIVSRLGDIASIKTNSFSPVKNPDAQLEHYSIPAYDEQNYPVFESAADVKSNKYILSKNSVMISKLNPDIKRVWRPMCLSELAVSSTEFIIFEAFNPAYRDFVFSIIDSAAFSDWMCAHTTGSTNSRQRTAPSATLEFQVALPDEKAIIDFCAIVTPMYDTIASNICENQKLAQLRDSILPKLMSGELDVSNIDL